MPNFTTFFQVVPASAIAVPGMTSTLPTVPTDLAEILTSLPALYAISADTAALIQHLAAVPAAPLRLAA